MTAWATAAQPSAVVISVATNEFSSARSLGGLRVLMRTLAPASRNRAVIAWPIPLVPPVTRTRLPSNSCGTAADSLAPFIYLVSTDATKHQQLVTVSRIASLFSRGIFHNPPRQTCSSSRPSRVIETELRTTTSAIGVSLPVAQLETAQEKTNGSSHRRLRLLQT